MSGDGRVNNWTIIKDRLLYTEVVDIKFTSQLPNLIQGDDLEKKTDCLRGKQSNSSPMKYGEDDHDLNVLQINLVNNEIHLCLF